jgi:xanthine dehydrogenase accessory factor
MSVTSDNLILIRGAGDLASGTALRLFHAGFHVVMTEIAQPSSVRRTVCFSEAVYHGRARVEDVEAVLSDNYEEIARISGRGKIPLFVDPDGALIARLRPAALVDAIIAKRNLGTRRDMAPLVIALGPGFTASQDDPAADCHAVIETMRGHTLGRVIREGSALPNTGVPGEIGGHGLDRLLRSPADGVFHCRARIGDRVRAGQVVAEVDSQPVTAYIDGVLRGLLPEGFPAWRGMKAGDVDPRAAPENCLTVSDKALAIAGGVLEALIAGGVMPKAS